MTQVEAEFFRSGQGTILHPTARICGPSGGPARQIELGDHCYIGEGVQIRCNDFRLGDYGKIHHLTNIHGDLPCSIGHNAWIGQFSIIDSTGGCTIGDNCGIGAHSQLWSHIKYGDTLEGCRFLQAKPLTIGNDVWFVGHCIVSPIVAANKAVVLAGSVVTRDLKSNHVYAGSPAADITDKVGAPFSDVPLPVKKERMLGLLAQSGVNQRNIRVVSSEKEIDTDAVDVTWFVLDSRKYTKKNTPDEISFMKFLLPEKAKFTPLS